MIKHTQRWLALFISALLLLGMPAVTAAAQGTVAAGKLPAAVLPAPEETPAVSSVAAQQAAIELPMSGENVSMVKGVTLQTGAHGNNGESLLTNADSEVTFAFSAAAGKYYLQIEYIPEKGSNSDIERSVLINGKLPFNQARNIRFNRLWRDRLDESGKFIEDVYGNQLRPSQEEESAWMTKYAMDTVGYITDPLSFTLKDGENTLTFVARAEAMSLRAVRLVPVQALPSYASVKAEYASAGLKEIPATIETIEAEKSVNKSDPVLYPSALRSSAAVEPSDPFLQMINRIGGANWGKSGQYITWKVEVEQEGLYRLALKSCKNANQGLLSYRRLYINDEIPFKEAENLSFNYNTSWTNNVLQDSAGTPYLFHFDKGVNTITLQVTLGDSGPILSDISDAILRLNSTYRRILVITGADPDVNRDYNLKALLPEVVASMKEEVAALQKIADNMFALSGEKGGNFAALDSLIRMIQNINKDFEKLPQYLIQFKSDIGALGTWLNTASNQTLELDRIYLYSADEELPSPDKNFFEQLWYSIKSLVASYFIDYNNIGDMDESGANEEPITVWINSGRDQYQVLKSLINDSYGKPVNLQLVQAPLLSAIVAGIAPDVHISSGDVVNYALRGALKDVSSFSDFPEVKKRFLDQAFIPFTLMGKQYALPETMDYSVMFYRRDILEDLKLPVPDTWDDVTRMVTELNKNNMTFGMGSDIGMYFILLEQAGGHIYNEEGTKAIFNNEQGIAVFKQFTNYFLNYSVPLSFDFQNRFRTGEMPIGLASYSLYNTLAIAAPEIAGLWDFALIPGTKREDGTIDRTNALGVTGCFILNDSAQPESSWDFIKWWTEEKTQTAYGREMESILGMSARYSPANVKAFEQMPWTTDQRKILTTQMNLSRSMPDVPGGYFTTRHFTNAFRNTVLLGEDPQNMLFEYINYINEELTGKRKEYGLPTAE